MINFDYDNDGDQDVVIFTNGGPLVLYRNDTPARAKPARPALALGHRQCTRRDGAHVVVTTLSAPGTSGSTQTPTT